MKIQQLEYFLNSKLKEIINEYELPGASVTLYKDGEACSANIGFIDENKQQPYTSKSIFRVGCLIKLFTAVQIMQLVEDNLVDLDAPIREYIPELDKLGFLKLAKITSRQLLIHQSGLVPNLFLGNKKLTTSNLIEAFSSKVEGELLLYMPGQYCSYSTLGYIVLAYIIEKVRNSCWKLDLNDNLFKPLGINCLQFQDNQESAPFGRILNNNYKGPMHHFEHPDIMPGDGGLLALNANDLMRYAMLHLNEGRAETGNSILSKQSIEEMQNTFAVPTGPWAGMKGLSFGWLAYSDGSFGFTGDGIRNHVLVRILPEANLALTVVANYHSAGVLFGDLWQSILTQYNVEFTNSIKQPEYLDACPEYIRETYIDAVREYKILWQDNEGEVTVTSKNHELMGKPITTELLHVKGNQFVAPGLGTFCNLTVLQLSNSKKFNYLWNGVALHRNIECQLTL